MDHLGRKDIGVAIPDGSGYVGTLNMWHEVHCIVSRLVFRLILKVLFLILLQKRLHQFMYQDYYFKDITPEKKEMNRLHSGKVFPDPSLIFAFFNTSSLRALSRLPPSIRHVPRRCRPHHVPLEREHSRSSRECHYP